MGRGTPEAGEAARRRTQRPPGGGTQSRRGVPPAAKSQPGGTRAALGGCWTPRLRPLAADPRCLLSAGPARAPGAGRADLQRRAGPSGPTPHPGPRTITLPMKGSPSEPVSAILGGLTALQLRRGKVGVGWARHH